MILPIVLYGDPVLKKTAKNLDLSELPAINNLVADMYETMYHAHGVGLAAPQIGKDWRLFVIDSQPMYEEGSGKGRKEAFINPVIVEKSGPDSNYEEGCLSIPGIRGDVVRPSVIKMQWIDLEGQPQEAVFDEMDARVIQHEYDHIEGVLFTDKLSSLRKQLIKGKLNTIIKGEVDADYRVRTAAGKIRG